MKIVIEPGVKEYLKKAGTNSLIINMIPSRTSAGCGCGKTKKFYAPDIRPAKMEEYFGKEFVEFQSDGLNLWVSRKAVEGSIDDTITISVSKSLFVTRLECKGIELVFD